MSINPVQLITQIVENRLANNNDPRPAQPSPVDSSKEVSSPDPNAGSPPKSEPEKSPNATASTPLPQDEVDVQRDSQTNGDVVVKYKDHSGNLILQVPSSQVLDVARAISQDFQHEAKVRAATETEDKGENSNGH